MRHSATILREVWCSGLVVTTSSRSASTSRINSKIVTSRRRRRSNSARRWRGTAEHRGVGDEARARRRQFSVTRWALAGGMKHEYVDRALVLLGASVQMLGLLT